MKARTSRRGAASRLPRSRRSKDSLRGDGGGKRAVAFTGELARLGRRALHELRAGGPPRLARQAVSKLVTYASYQHQRARQGRTFVLDGEEFQFFLHPYGATWRNERAIEVPLARAFLRRQTGDGLELGNVLSHYGPVRHTVVDLYEHAPGVRNVDILDFTAPGGLDFIVTISTLEHVGWDEVPRDGHRAVLALDHLQSLLRPGGSLFVTAPIGHNPVLDEEILSGRREPTRERFLLRDPNGKRFEVIDRQRARDEKLVFGATIVLWVAEFKSEPSRHQ